MFGVRECAESTNFKGMFEMTESKEIIFACDEGLKKIADELEFLKTVRRPEISEKIKIARGFGDLSENAEYDEAKKEQAEVEEKIMALEDIVKHSRVIREDEITDDAVCLGSKVTLLDVEYDEELEYDIVSTVESDPDNDKISVESPVGKSLLGKAVGESVKVKTPNDEIEFKILSISRM